MTLAVEVLAITRLAAIPPIRKVILVVCGSNVLSYLAPYIWNGLTSELYSFEQLLEGWPMYTVCTVYLIVTVLIELPVVYYALRKYTDNRKRLILVTIGANVVTTALTALAERIFCHGSW